MARREAAKAAKFVAAAGASEQLARTEHKGGITVNATGFRPPWNLGDAHAESVWPISSAETNFVQEWAAGRIRLNSSSRHEQQEALLIILRRKGKCPDLVSQLERRYHGSWVLKAYGQAVLGEVCHKSDDSVPWKLALEFHNQEPQCLEKACWQKHPGVCEEDGS